MARISHLSGMPGVRVATGRVPQHTLEPCVARAIEMIVRVRERDRLTTVVA
jgi:hypothetical protein